MAPRKKPAPPVKPNEKVLDMPRFRGAPLALLKNHDHAVVIVGPKDCSKTWAACAKMVYLCTDPNRPKVRGAMVRKTFHSLFDSCVKTFDTITQDLPLKRLGGRTYRDRVIFPNGSEIVCVGLDSAQKLQSSEWGFIYVNQCEEITENDFEMVAGCVSGRGTSVAYPQILGDCNPSGSRHWIRERSQRGQLTLLNATHKDNPVLYDDAGNITSEGQRRIGILKQTLTGVRRKRLLEGMWATAEGAVFDTFDPALHVCERLVAEMKHFWLAMDEGTTNPAVILLVGGDSDGRWHVFKEYYKTGQAPELVVATAKDWFQRDGNRMTCELAAVDDAAAGLIMSLNSSTITNDGRRQGPIHAVGGKGRIIDGVYAIQNRLELKVDKRPRLTIDPSCINTINEFESHVWRPDKPKDTPLDCDNHSISSIRYLHDVLTIPSGAWSVADIPVRSNDSQPEGAEAFTADLAVT